MYNKDLFTTHVRILKVCNYKILGNTNFSIKKMEINNYCTMCDQNKPLSEFEYRTDRNTYRNQCKGCRYEDRKVEKKRVRCTYCNTEMWLGNVERHIQSASHFNNIGDALNNETAVADNEADEYNKRRREKYHKETMICSICNVEIKKRAMRFHSQSKSHIDNEQNNLSFLLQKVMSIQDERIISPIGCSKTWLLQWFKFTKQNYCPRSVQSQIDYVTSCSDYDLTTEQGRLEFCNWRNLRVKDSNEERRRPSENELRYHNNLIQEFINWMNRYYVDQICAGENEQLNNTN